MNNYLMTLNDYKQDYIKLMSSICSDFAKT